MGRRTKVNPHKLFRKLQTYMFYGPVKTETEKKSLYSIDVKRSRKLRGCICICLLCVCKCSFNKKSHAIITHSPKVLLNSSLIIRWHTKTHFVQFANYINLFKTHSNIDS